MLVFYNIISDSYKGEIIMDENASNPFKNDEIDEDIDINETIKSNESSEVLDEDVSDNNDNELQTKYETLNQQYIRLAADFENYRKRQEQERESLIKFGTENALTKLIEVLDNFERGQKSLEGVDDCVKIKESFDLIQKQVYESLAKLGLEEIKAVGEDFDPNYHEAVMQTPTSEYKEHTVISELRKGYKFGDKVLRPAMVNVATAE